MLTGIKNGKILLPGGEILQGSVLFEKGKIKKIVKGNGLKNADGLDMIDAEGNWIFPGFIDLHCHGAMGHDVMDGTREAVEAIAAYHAKGGTTTFLATTASSSPEVLFKALEVIREARSSELNGASVIGAHIEGPYFAFTKRGCHLPAYIRNPKPEEYNKILDFADCISLMTLAPELDGAEELIKLLHEKNIVASLGHSEALYSEIADAVRWGATHVTHMYCAMSTIKKDGPKRFMGLVETTLLLDELTTEVIADGIHLPPELIRMVVKAKGIEKVCLVTDAMRGAGMPDGIYSFGPKDGQLALVQNGMALMPDKTGFASSVVQMIDLIRTMVNSVGISVADAVYMASYVPARIINHHNKMGSIEPGKDANVVIADESLKIKATVVNARKVF
jgi:N-acetylglucosamine-6-phosphate deacetylase